MADNVFLAEYLEQFFDEVTPKEFYRDIFPVGELEKKGERVQGKYNAIAVELVHADKEDTKVKKYVVTDDLEVLDYLLLSDNFIIISPISYIGKNRKSDYARYIYALAIDLDGVESEQNIRDLIHQIENEYLPKPTYIVWSGSGLHLYYQFVQPLPCFTNIVKQLSAMKDFLTKQIWNRYITVLYDKAQIQSLFQGFRIVGGITKGGNRVRAFIIGDKVSVDYLNDFIYDKNAQLNEYKYKSNLTLSAAAAAFPEWYDRRIVKKQPKNSWKCKEDLYNWWLNKLKNETKVGHRYFCIMCLAVYAKKCGISEEQLEKDAFSLFELFENLTTDEKNHFTKQDILAALEMYNDNYIRFPIDSITKLTDIKIQKNKRNFRKQDNHLKFARNVKQFKKDNNEEMYDGRPSKGYEVITYKNNNAAATIKDCIKETGISKSTVYKYWNLTEEEKKRIIKKTIDKSIFDSHKNRGKIKNDSQRNSR